VLSYPEDGANLVGLAQTLARSSILVIVRTVSSLTLPRQLSAYTDVHPEWLFKRVSVVVHHGGAGTTACGLVNARPTIIVPFFGE
jgi:UDP:flavonoid glycosyltransferase YjiC (YdhE family)